MGRTEPQNEKSPPPLLWEREGGISIFPGILSGGLRQAVFRHRFNSSSAARANHFDFFSLWTSPYAFGYVAPHLSPSPVRHIFSWSVSMNDAAWRTATLGALVVEREAPVARMTTSRPEQEMEPRLEALH